LHAEADEVLRPAVVHPDRHADHQGPLRLHQPLQDAPVDIDGVGHHLQLATGHLERGSVLKHRERVHAAVVLALVVAMDFDNGTGHANLHGWPSCKESRPGGAAPTIITITYYTDQPQTTDPGHGEPGDRLRLPGRVRRRRMARSRRCVRDYAESRAGRVLSEVLHTRGL